MFWRHHPGPSGESGLQERRWHWHPQHQTARSGRTKGEPPALRLRGTALGI